MWDIKLLGGTRVSGTEPSGPSSALQGRRLALLAILALAKNRLVTRDTLIGYLWANHSKRRAHQALSDAVYHLRQALGEDAVIGRGPYELNAQLVKTDAAEFTAAFAERDYPRAVASYTGPLL